MFAATIRGGLVDWDELSATIAGCAANGVIGLADERLAGGANSDVRARPATCARPPVQLNLLGGLDCPLAQPNARIADSAMPMVRLIIKKARNLADNSR